VLKHLGSIYVQAESTQNKSMTTDLHEFVYRRHWAYKCVKNTEDQSQGHSPHCDLKISVRCLDVRVCAPSDMDIRL